MKADAERGLESQKMDGQGEGSLENDDIMNISDDNDYARAEEAPSRLVLVTQRIVM